MLTSASRRVNKSDVQFYLFVSFVNCHPHDTWHQYKFNWRHEQKKKAASVARESAGKNADDTLGKAETYVRSSTRKRHLHEWCSTLKTMAYRNECFPSDQRIIGKATKAVAANSRGLISPLLMGNSFPRVLI